MIYDIFIAAMICFGLLGIVAFIILQINEDD